MGKKMPCVGALERTSYRYEIMGPKDDYHNYRCGERLRLDAGCIGDHENSVHETDACKAASSARWRANMEDAAYRSHMAKTNKTIRDEVAMSNVASIKVRKAALKHLLEKDFMCYEKEMNAIDKAFYVDRI